jgi:L-fucose isomerase-like protein
MMSRETQPHKRREIYMNKSKDVKVGFIPFGIHVGVEDATGRQFIDRELMDLSEKCISDMGFKALRFQEVVSYKHQAKKALEYLKEQDADVMILYSTTWVWASELMWLAKELQRPIILWSPATSRGWTNVGALEVHGALDEIGLEHLFVIGQYDDEKTQRRIYSYCKAAKAKRDLQGSTAALIGGRGMGETTGTADPSQWMSLFGIDIEHVDQLVLMEAAKAVDVKEVEKEYVRISGMFDNVPELEGIMDKSVRLYISMKKFYNDKNFDFAAVKCFPELGDNYATPCLAQSLLAEDGFTSSCIGDLNTALSAQVLGCFSDEAVYSGDIQQVRYWENIIKIVCDGCCPPSLAGECKDCSVCMRGLPTEGAAGGMGVSTVLKKGRCTLAHLCRVKGEFVMHIAPGEVFEPGKDELVQMLRECGIPHWPHAFVKLEGSGETFYQNQRGEFTSLAYGDHEDELADFCRLTGIKAVVTK